MVLFTFAVAAYYYFVRSAPGDQTKPAAIAAAGSAVVAVVFLLFSVLVANGIGLVDEFLGLIATGVGATGAAAIAVYAFERADEELQAQ